jgi:signal peptidase I
MTQETGIMQPSPADSKNAVDFFDRLQFTTEKYLRFRRRKKRIRKEKQRKKNVILDWLDAFLWAAGMVLLANQFLIQAYQIPSGSMIDTLLVGDRIFVNKIIYGPELLPGVGKLPSPVKPKKNDIIIFENPEYLSRGPVFDVAQRIIFMLTLSLVDINKDEYGNPSVQFLIKRAAGAGGDWFIQERGNMRFRPAGENRWIDEQDYIAQRGMTHNVSRLINESVYPAIEADGKARGYTNLRLEIPAQLERQTQVLSLPMNQIRYLDPSANEKARLEIIRGANPHDRNLSKNLARLNQGIYVPESRILPLGDNRDNSKDGRSFGTVKSSKILGKALIICFPGDMGTQGFKRFGLIK